MIKKETSIQAEAELVWKAWTEPERITQWFAPEADIEAFPGGKFELYFIPGNKDSMSTKGCKVLRAEPNSLLEFQWKAPDNFAFMNHGNLTTVSVLLESRTENAVSLTLEHRGWMPGQEWEEAQAWHEKAWDEMLSNLKSKLENGHARLCCR